MRHSEHFTVGPHQPMLGFERLDGGKRDVFEFIRHDIGARPEFADGSHVVVGCDDLSIRNLSARRVR